MLEAAQIEELARAWLREDVGRGDRTTQAVVPAEARGRARIEAREDGVVAGLPVAAVCFSLTSDGATKFVAEVGEGDRFASGDVLARIEGPLAPILTAERTALNILQRLSGVAGIARSYVEAVAGTGARVVDTRKTTPGLRTLEKYAVAVGGAGNHRSGLDDGILVKDNHIAAAGSVAEATRRAVSGAPHGLVVEVEITSLDDLEDAIDAGAHAILLDNMGVAEVRTAVAAAGGRVTLEASGGITLDNIRAYAEAGVDLISVGALTHSAPAADISLEVEV